MEIRINDKRNFKKSTSNLIKHIQISKAQKISQLIVLPDIMSYKLCSLLYVDWSNIKGIIRHESPPPFSPIGLSVKGTALLLPIDSGCATKMRTNNGAIVFKSTHLPQLLCRLDQPLPRHHTEQLHLKHL